MSRQALATLSTPRATVLPMSCSLRSTKTFLPAIGELADQRQSAGISELIADLVKRHAVAEPGDHRFRRGDARADRAPRSTGRGERYRLAACHLTSCAGKHRSIAAPARSAPRYRPDVSTGPYRHRPRSANDSASWFGITVAWQADKISRSAARASRAAEPAFRGRRDRKRRARETPGRGSRAHPAPGSPSRWCS